MTKEEELIEYIKQYNEMLDREFEENAIIPQLPEDVSYWEEIGVRCKDDLNKYMLLTTVFETAKLKGIEKDWKQLITLSITELSEELEKIIQ